MATVSRGEITIINVDDGRTSYLHTAYANSIDFGSYDYSGNPNLMKNITNDSWTAEGAMKITAAGDYLELVKDTAGQYGNAVIYNIPALRSDSQYTTSLEFYLKSGIAAEDLKKCNIAIEATNTNGQVYYSVIYMNDIPKMDEWVDLRSTFTTNADADNLINWKFRVYIDPNVSASMRIRNSIKIEKGSKATPYQPNLLEEPFYLGKVALGKNIADTKKVFPIKTSEYNIYQGKNTEKYQANQTYTITMKATKPASQQFRVYVNAGTMGIDNMKPVEGLTDVWQLTFKITQDHIDGGITDVLTVYQLPNSSTGQCTIDWLKIEKGSARTPNIESYKYMGMYIDTTQTPVSNPTQYAWSQIKGDKGDSGKDGIAGKDGVGLKSTSIHYATSKDGTHYPKDGWSEQVPTVPGGDFLWTRTVWTYTDNTSEAGYSVAKMGKDGAKGDDGIAGKDGVGIKSTKIEYVVADNGVTAPTTGWSTTIPSIPSGQFLWTKTTWTYTDDTTEVGFTVAKQGEKGDKGIPGDKGADGRTQYTHIAYADSSTGAGFSQFPDGKAYIGLYVDFEELDSNDPAKYTWSLIKGEKGESGKDGIAGKDGVGLKTTSIEYASSSDGVNHPTSGWTNQVPQVPGGSYLWTKTTWTYTDSTSETGYSVARMGADGANGHDGIAGKDGVGINDTKIEYAVSTSGVEKPTSQWTTQIPNVPDGQYLWTKTTWTYTDNTSETGYSVAKMGAKGDKGDKGDSGHDGIAGKDGVGLKSTTIQYAASANGTVAPSSGWAAQVPSVSGGQYLWTKTIWTYTDNTSETGYSVSHIGKDGANGQDGIAGKDGVGIKSTKIEYMNSANGTNAPTTGWTTQIPITPEGQYLWTKTTWTYTDDTVEIGYSVAKMGVKGDKGDQGDKGIPGDKGADGRTQYTHIAYADDSAGKGFSQSPENKSYIGMYVDFTEQDSSDPKAYAWSLIRGADGKDGIAGKPGADGKTPYFHTAYTNSTDFGTYDYSGNPNLMKNITNDSWTAEGAMKITAVGDYLELVKDTAGQYGNAVIYNIPALHSNSQYTTSMEFYLKSGTSTEDLKKCNIAIEATNTSGQVYYSVIYMNNIPKMDEWVDLTSTFTTNTYTDNLTNWKFRVYVHPDVSASMRIRNSIKIEKGSKATPYQPNLIDTPYYLSKVTLGKNIANKGTTFPIKSSAFNLYNSDTVEELVIGQTYTITLKGTKPTTQTFAAFNRWDVKFGDLKPVEGLTNVWSLTFTPTKLVPDFPKNFRIYQSPEATAGACQIDWLKIEKGSVRTPNIDTYKYLGTYTDFEQSDSLNPTKYHWNQVRGEDGAVAKTFLLSASNNIVKRNQQGVPINETIKFTVQMQNMVGVATFSAVPYINNTPQTAIALGGTGNIRTFSTSSWNTSWTSIVVKATFDKFDDTQTLISIQEGKDGVNAITGLLTNESVSLTTNSEGTITNLSDANGVFKVFDGLSDVTGKNVTYAIKSSLNGTFDLNTTTGAYSVKTITGKSAQAIFTATYKSVIVEKTLSVTKVQDGKTTYVDTLYSNSIDFGNYDYSGNPNLMSVIKASDFKSQGDSDVSVSDVGYNNIRLTSRGVNHIWTYSNNIPSLASGKTYTISAKVKLEEGTTGNIGRVTVSYRKVTGGTILLAAISDEVAVGKEITIKGTGVVNYKINELSAFYLDIECAGVITGSVIVSDVKIEEGSTVTPYQPNLLDNPYYLGKTSLRENIASKAVKFPFTTSNYPIYGASNIENYKVGQTYTLTMKAVKPATQSFGIYLKSGTIGAGTMLPVEGLTDVWQLTFKITQAQIDQGVTNNLSIYQLPADTKGAVTIDWLKIEKGSARTPNIESYKYMGMYIGTTQAPTSNPTQYAWSQIKGEDITTYSLELSSQVMTIPKGTNTLVPANIVVKGISTMGNHPEENITSRITVEETVDGNTWITKHDADVRTYTYVPTSTNIISARIKMFVAGDKTNQLDQKSIAIVRDGNNGSNGSSTYTWIRYSENATGNPMTTTPNNKTKYIGIAITNTNTAPTEFSKYTWSRIKGNGGLVAKVYSNSGSTIHSSPIQINVETQSDGDIVEPSKVTWYYSKDSSTGWQALTTNSDVKVELKSITVQPSFFLGASAISFKAQVEYQSMAAFDTISVNNESFDATRPLILRQPTAPINPYPGLLWLDTSSGSGKPLDKTNPSLVYRWGKTITETIDGSEYLHYAYSNSPTGDTDFSTTYNSSNRPQYIGICITDTEADPTTATSYNWKSITTEDGSEDKNGDKGIAQDKIIISEQWGWIVLNAEDLKMLPWLNNEDGSTIIDWIYQITNKTSDNSIVQTVVGSEDMSKVYAKTENMNELADANNELSAKLEEYNQQMQSAFAGLDATYINKSEFEQEMTKFNFGIDKAGGVNLIRNSTGFQWNDYTPGAEMLKNPKFEGNPLTIWNYNVADIGQVLASETDMKEYKILRIGNSTNANKWSCSEHITVTPGSLINVSGQARFPNTIGNTRRMYISVRFYAAGTDPLISSVEQTINNGQGYINLYTDQTFDAGTSLNELVGIKSNGSAKDVWNNYSLNIHVPNGAATMRLCLVNGSSEQNTYFDFRCPSVITYTGMFDFWHKSKQTNASIRQVLGDESLEELGLIAGFELKGHTYFLDQNLLLPHANTEYTLSWYVKKASIAGSSKYFVKIYDLKTNKELASSDGINDTIGYQRMSVTFTAADSKELFIRIGLEGTSDDANAILTAAGLMVNIGPYPLSWQSHHEEVYSTNVRIDSSGLKVFNSDYDGYNVMTPKEFAGYYRNGGAYEQVFTLNKDTTKVKKLEAQERFMMSPLQIVSLNSDNVQGWAFVAYNGEDTD